MYDFQPQWKTWEERSLLVGERAVLDPLGSELKNHFIDRLQKSELEKVFQSIENRDRCLDFGCGVGRLHDFITEYFNSYCGIDVTSSMIEKAKAIYTDEFYSYDGLNMPILDDSIDAIVSVLVLQHINNPSEYEKIVKEFKRVIKQGGYVVFIEQISGEKTKGNYTVAFEQEGFSLKRVNLVRRGKSISSWISSRKWCGMFPEKVMLSLLACINRIEIEFPPIKKTYQEYIFVFRKEQKVEI